MSAKNPFDKYLDQLEDIFSTIQEHKGPLNITPELLKELDALEKNMNLYQEAFERVMKKEGIDIHAPVERSLTEQEKQFQERSKKLEDDAVLYQKRVELTLKNIKEKNKAGKAPRKTAKARKKKFKSLEGDGWIPM